MKIRSLFLALAAGLITSVGAHASVLFTSTVSYNYSGSFHSDTDSTSGTSFQSDVFYIDGGDGIYIQATGASNEFVDETSGRFEIGYDIESASLASHPVGLNLVTTIKFSLSHAGEGSLTTSWGSLPTGGTLTVTLNNVAVNAGPLIFKEGENTLVYSLVLSSSSLPDSINDSYSISVDVIPEPGSWALLACGAGAMLVVARRRKATRLAA